MIYTTGTVSTVSGSAIVSGTGTKWTVNNPAIRSGTIILIKNGNANFIYMVDRVNSDTELVISQPATFTVKNTSYSINLTEPNSYSDANNRMTAIASDTTYFLRAMDQWMMNNGVVTVELSNGQKVTLDSIKKMQGDISKKADDNKTVHIGDYGVGLQKIISHAVNVAFSGFFTGSIDNSSMIYMGVSSMHVNGGYLFQIAGRQKKIIARVVENGSEFGVFEIYHSGNTTVDSNGFIKKASPIININPDGTFTTNDESEGATVTQVAQGEYLIEGVLGFNSDAGWGGVDGGIEIPLDVNKQPLIWVDSKVMKDGSILVRTYHRTHPNAPKFARNDIDGYKDGDPIDIPDGRFISVRVQMPEQSIYNVRMREMEEAQKVEEERRKKEEEMKEQYGSGENDVLL
ncbi:phage protein [Klebsiella pneumoniae]|nr:phage protein [Klebsiella pneumoniae]